MFVVYGVEQSVAEIITEANFGVDVVANDEATDTRVFRKLQAMRVMLF
jgi:hypothetical protein